MEERQAKEAALWCLRELPGAAVLTGKGPTKRPFREAFDEWKQQNGVAEAPARIAFESYGSEGYHPWTMRVQMDAELLIAWVREREQASTDRIAALTARLASLEASGAATSSAKA